MLTSNRQVKLMRWVTGVHKLTDLTVRCDLCFLFVQKMHATLCGCNFVFDVKIQYVTQQNNAHGLYKKYVHDMAVTQKLQEPRICLIYFFCFLNPKELRNPFITRHAFRRLQGC